MPAQAKRLGIEHQLQQVSSRHSAGHALKAALSGFFIIERKFGAAVLLRLNREYPGSH